MTGKFGNLIRAIDEGKKYDFKAILLFNYFKKCFFWKETLKMVS